jgi:two-component system NtrC family sensor kinase
MKIEHKLILSYFFYVIFIVLIGLFSFQDMNRVLAKLRFVEIADDLNASFLEMRISEKNFYLYKDDKALGEITDMISSTMKTIDTMKVDISRAIGNNNFEQLKLHLNKYAAVIEEIKSKGRNNTDLELKLRTEGMGLRDFSKSITQIERKLVNDIILSSKKFLFISFWVILLTAVTVGHFVSKKILNSLRAIEKVALSISNGNFSKIEDIKSNDEFGSVIKAINYMSEQLETREEVILQSRKLASLGILTAGVAHELVNPLNNISMI